MISLGLLLSYLRIFWSSSLSYGSIIFRGSCLYLTSLWSQGLQLFWRDLFDPSRGILSLYSFFLVSWQRRSWRAEPIISDRLDFPKSSQFVWGLSEVLGSTAPWLQKTFQKVYSLPSILILWKWRRFWQAASLLYDSIFRVAVFPCVMWGGEYKIEVIWEMFSNVLQGFITDLPCHIVTFQISAWVCYGYYI